MDDQFLQSVLCNLYDENLSKITKKAGMSGLGAGGKKDTRKRSNSNQKLLQRPEEQKHRNTHTVIMTDRRTEKGQIGGQTILFDLDYMKEEQNVRALQDYNWINEEAITKLKIVAMGNILAQGVFERVQGDTNKIVLAFCENIERHHLKRPEMNLHIFFYLYQLFQYIKDSDEQAKGPSRPKLKIFSKQYLDLRTFFTKVLPEVANYLKDILKDTNIDDKLKHAKLPDEVLKPFKEKASLVLLSILNYQHPEKFRVIIFNDAKKLNFVVQSLKKLSNKIAFQEPYGVYFEKKKVQVLRKVIMMIIGLLMQQDPQQIPPEYHQTIVQCRLLLIYLWNKLAKIKADFKQTMRAKALVKDQLKVSKGRMMEHFKDFWMRFMHLGQSWKSLKGSMSKQFQNLIKLHPDKGIAVFMRVISDTLTLEYQQNGDIFDTSGSIFKVFYDLCAAGREDIVSKFFGAFEGTMRNYNQLFKENAAFQKLVLTRFDQMRQLQDGVRNVMISRTKMKENTFYRAFCLAQLIEVLWELKLFKLFLENQEQFEGLNIALENNLEVAFTQLRFVESMEHQTEDDRLQIGQKEIFAHIQLKHLQKVQKFFQKAEFFEKAIEILNKQKDIAENVLFDFELVSQIVVSKHPLISV